MDGSEALTSADGAIGIDVGGTAIKGLVASAGSVLVSTAQEPTGPEAHGRQILDDVIRLAKNLVEAAKRAEVAVKAVGIGIPGAVDAEAGVGKASANLLWKDFPVGKTVGRHLDLPVFVEQDVYLGALAEFTMGAARNDQSSAYVPLGTGTGCTIMLNRRIWRGSTRFAGEIGHLDARAGSEECGCGRSGCVELAASARGLERLYAAWTPDGEREPAHEIARAAEQGNPEARAAWNTCIERIAWMLESLVLTVDVESIVVGGGLRQAGAQLGQQLELALQRRLSPLREAPRLRLSAFGNESGARGAALHALSKLQGRSATRIQAVQRHTSTTDILMLAFDHRTSMVRDLFGVPDISSRQRSQLEDIKTLIAASVLWAAPQVWPEAQVSTLVDPEYGLAAGRLASQAGLHVALAMEHSGQRELSLLDTSLLKEAIESLETVKWGKTLLRWNPGDTEDRKARNIQTLETAKSLCRAMGIDFLLELIVPATPQDLRRCGGSKERFDRELLPHRMPEAIHELTSLLGPPDLWKVEGLESAAACNMVVEAARSAGSVPPIVVLGAGSGVDRINRWFQGAASASAYTGFAIGRSIWKDPIQHWMNGEASRSRTQQVIASRFLRYVDDYRIAVRVAPVSDFL